MRHHQRSLWSDQRGMVLVMALILMGLLSALAGIFSMMVRADTVLRGGSARMRDGFYAAEAGLNVGMAQFGTIFKDYGVPAGSAFDAREVVVGNRTVEYQLAPVPGYDPCTEGEDANCFTTIPAGQKFAGLTSIPYRYTVKSTAVNVEGDEESNLGAQFDVHNIPIFQFLAFYTNDLEILPGPDMNLHGRIHTNRDLYLSAGNTFTIGDLNPSIPNVQVSAARSIHRGRKDDATCGGSVIIDKLEDSVAPTPNDYDPLPLACSGGSSVVPKTTLDAYKGSMLDGVATIQVPPVSSIARGKGNLFWDRADLRIVLRLDLPKAQINFDAAGLCPATATTPAAPLSPVLYPIEVQDENGVLDTAKTTALWQFMCQQRGAIFYNDRPTNAVDGTPSDTVARNPNNYAPVFGGINPPDNTGGEQNQPAYTGTAAGMTPLSDYRVYRRVGYNTDGNGVITTKDWNPDVCPVSLGGVAAATKPWWIPAYCTWPSATTTQTLWYKDTDYRRGGYYNQRERKWMFLLNVNVRALIEWNAQNGDRLFPHDDRTDWGLVFFLSVQGPNSGGTTKNNYGVRVFDAASLDTRGVTFPSGAADPTGLTVVSDQAMYVEGNYNYFSGQTAAQKQPAAVIGDSVNVMSQSWEASFPSGGIRRGNDRKSVNSFAYRFIQTADSPGGNGGPTAGAFSSATGLGINAAFLANVDDTVGSAYNGGLENYPRFHEDWSNGSRTLKYRGSYVSLGIPQHVNGAWVYGDPVYTAPNRNWDFDADFSRVEFLPPLTPKITYVQQNLYTRFYK